MSLQPLLHYAIVRRNLSEVRDLIAQGVDLDGFDSEGLTALSAAANIGFDEGIQVLTTAGAGLDTKSDDAPWPPLICSARFRHLEATRLLIAAGADLETPGVYGRRALHYAAEYGAVDIIRLLLDAGADINSPSDRKETPLWVAAGSPLGEGPIQTLLGNGADVNLANSEGVTPLAWSVFRERLAAAQLLIAGGADVNICGQYSLPPLANAASHGDLDGVVQLIEAGADVNKRDSIGCTAIFEAAEEGYVEIVQYLIQHGADVNIQDADEKTALDVAKENNQAKVVEVLRDAQSQSEKPS